MEKIARDLSQAQKRNSIFHRRMPEEINRVLTDRISTLLFCPTETAIKNLKREGIIKGALNVGDVMYNSFLYYKNITSKKSDALINLDLQPRYYCLATIHRQENTDIPSRLIDIFEAFDELATVEMPFVIPLHPRTRKARKSHKIQLEKNLHIRVISPRSYLDMIYIECQLMQY